MKAEIDTEDLENAVIAIRDAIDQTLRDETLVRLVCLHAIMVRSPDLPCAAAVKEAAHWEDVFMAAEGDR